MSRYTPDELERWFFLPAAASTAAPTVANFTAGEEITKEVASVSGFTFSGGKVDTPDLGNRFTTSVAGRLTAEDSSLQFYMGSDEDDPERAIYDLLPRTTTGFIVRVHPSEGAKAAIAAATVVEVWPVEVMSRSVDSPSPGEAQKFTVQFSIPRQPVEDAVIAA